MKTFEINGKAYEIKPCTAICFVELGDESKRQEALLVTCHEEETSEYVVFGYDMPETVDGFRSMCEDEYAWESDFEVLETVVCG